MQQEMTVVISIEAHTAMLRKCDDSRLEYALLKNGVITRNSQCNEQVEIICSSREAKQIVDFVATDCPELSPSVIVISPAPHAV
jgi:hypothetical protein